MANPLAPVLINPVQSSYQTNAASPVRFSWLYKHTEPGKTQASMAIRRRLLPAGTYEYWTGAAWSASLTYVANTNSFYDINGSTFTANTAYAWSVSTRDTSAGTGPFSAEQAVKFVAIPTLVVTLSTPITVSYPRIFWTYSQTNGLPQVRYRVALYTAAQVAIGGFTPFTSPSTWESGWKESDSAYFIDSEVAVANGVVYTAYVQVETFNGLASAATASATATASLVLPASPTVVALPNNTTGAVDITIDSAFNLLDSNTSGLPGPAPGNLGTWVASTDADLSWVASAPVMGGTALLITSTGMLYNELAGLYASYTAQNAAYASYNAMKAALATATTSRATTAFGLSGTPVVGGQVYSAAFRAIRGAGSANVQCRIAWYKSDGSPSSITAVSSGTALAVGSGASVDVKCENITAPADAAFAAVQVQCTIAAPGELIYVNRPVLARGATATYSSGGFGTDPTFVVERYNRRTASWDAVPGYSRTTPGMTHIQGAGRATIKDGQAPMGSTLPILYRAFAIGAGGVYSAETPVSMTDPFPGNSWWLRDPLDPTRDRAIAQVEFLASYTVNSEISAPVGRAKPVVLRLDTPVYDSFNISIWTATEQERMDIETLLKSQRTLTVQNVNGIVWWVEVVGDVTWEQVMAKGSGLTHNFKHLFRINAPVVEVSQPVISYTYNYATNTQTWSRA